MITVIEKLRLTATERKLIDAVGEDEEADFRKAANGQKPDIRAAVLQALCTGASPDWPVKNRIRIAGARIRGRVDLSGTFLKHELRFTDCVFEDRVELQLARAQQAIEWNGGQVAGIFADEFESKADFIIQHVKVTGPISLHWASIRRDLRLTGSRLEPPCDRVFYGKDLRVGGSVFLDGPGFRAAGEVCLSSAHIEGQLDCRHAEFRHPQGHAIRADHVVVGGEILCEEEFHSDGEVCLQWGKVNRLRATGGTFRSSTAYALHADALRAEAGVYLDRGFHATATVRLVGANITGELCCTEGFFDNQSGRALDAERVVVDDVYLDRGFCAYGDVRFNDAQVTRQLNATAGKFCNDRRGENEYALDCDGLYCGADVFLNEGFRATGAVSLRGADIKNELNCTAGSFTNPDGYALFADGLTTPGTVFLDDRFGAIGEVRFARATVGRQLVCTNGVFDNPHGTSLDLTGLITPGDILLNGGFRATSLVTLCDARITRDLDFRDAALRGTEGLDARGAEIGGCLTWRMDKPPEGKVDLSFGQIGQLDDAFSSWAPGKYVLAGLAFRTSVNDSMTAEQRIDWLDHTEDYSASPYRQLADAYRLHGREGDAEKVLIACQRHLRTRGKIGKRSKLWNWFLEVTVGYGHRLHRVFITLAVLLVISVILFYWGQQAGLVFAINQAKNIKAPACIPGGPCFNPLTYSFQLLVPGLDLREATYWLPNTTVKPPWGHLLMWYTWSMIIVGWIAATAVIAGIARIFRPR